MNTAAKHEAGHAVAIRLLGLADILRPGGAAVTSGGGGIVALDCERIPDMAALVARIDCNSDVPCEPAVAAARQRPDLAPALVVFMLAGYGATPGTWRGDFARTIAVRVSSDFKTAEAIIRGLIDFDGWTAEDLVLSETRDALDRAVIWSAQSHVLALIDRVAAHLDAHGAATWNELENIFSAHGENESFDRDSVTPCVPGKIPLAGDQPGTVAGVAPSAMVEIQCAEQSEQNTKGKV